MRKVLSLFLALMLLIAFAPGANAAKGAVLNQEKTTTESESRAASESSLKDIARFEMYG